MWIDSYLQFPTVHERDLDSYCAPVRESSDRNSKNRSRAEVGRQVYGSIDTWTWSHSIRRTTGLTTAAPCSATVVLDATGTSPPKPRLTYTVMMEVYWQTRTPLRTAKTSDNVCGLA